MLYEVASPASFTSSLAVHEGPRIDYRFIDDLREFISRRLDKVNPYKESKEYRLQQEKASRLFEEIKEMLPEEGQVMLVEYSDALGAAHCLEVEMLGERAFLDGMRMVLRALEAERGGTNDFN